MAFVTITNIEKGRPFSVLLFKTIKDNFDDHEARLLSIEAGHIDHDSLDGFVADEHIAHSSVSITGTDGLTGGGDISASRTISMPAVGTAGSYGDAISIPVITTDAKGRVSGVVATTIRDASALVSGVVSVGAQSFEGDKEFLKEVKVPVAVAETSAVQKSQLTLVAGDLADFIATKGVADGLAPLDSNAKLPNSYLSDTILGQVSYQGLYDAALNSPDLDVVGAKGQYYIISAAGTLASASLSFEIGDWIISNGTSWNKVDNTDAVSTVAGRTGNVVLDKTDVGLANVDNTSDADKPVSSATQTALNLKSDATHVHDTTDITDLRITGGTLQFNNGVGWVTLSIGGVQDLVFSTAVSAVAVVIAHGIADISTIVGQSSSVVIGTELFIQGSAVAIGAEKFGVYIDSTNITIDPYEDLAGASVRVHLAVQS